MRTFSHGVLKGGPLAALAVLVLAGCGVPGPTGPPDSYGLDFSLPKGAPARGAIVFFIDGVNAEVFQRMLQSGELPAIRKYFVDRGLYCPAATSNLPSVTLPNLTSFVTGLMPGHHGVTGINWFDRNQLIWREYNTIAQKGTLDGDYAAATLYEHFPYQTTVSDFFQPHRGATRFIEDWASAGPPFFFGWYEFIDRLTLSRFGMIMDIARKRNAFPSVVIAYLLAPDFRAYGYGIETPQYRRALRHSDDQIGRVLGDLERAGLLDKIVIVLAADHGFCAVRRHFLVAPFLRERMGLDLADRRLWESTPFESRQDYYEKHQVVQCGSGDRFWSIYLRKPLRKDGQAAGLEPWLARPAPEDLANYPTPRGTVDLLTAFCRQEAVDALAYRVGKSRVRLRNKAGEVEFRQDGGPAAPISYHLLSGADPLCYGGLVPAEVLDGKGLTPRQWFDATARTEYPDLPAQLLAYFRARRAGDLVLFAAPGWDFHRTHKSGHGGIRAADVHMPLLLAGPGVPHAQVPAARLVDMMPTLLTLLGKPVPPGLDGESLVPVPDHQAAASKISGD